MLKIKVNGNKELSLDWKNNIIHFQGKPLSTDVIWLAKDKFHIILNNGSYLVELLSNDESGKEMTISVNGKKQTVSIKDQYDELLQKLGMDKVSHSKMNEVKAPMPGLVLKVMVNEGDSFSKGDALLVLEAMKMENIIKATGDGKVKKILVQTKQAVDKNQVLLNLE